jgi:hypothetical protein
LRSTLRPTPASTTLQEDSRTSAWASTEPAARPTAKPGPAWAARSAESGGSGLPRDGIFTVSETAAPVRPEVAGLREATGGNLAHCDSSDHLDGIRGRGLSKLSAGLCNILVFCSDFGGVLVLAV